MELKEQLYVIKNLTTGRFVFNASSQSYCTPSYTKVLPDAQCFETIEQAEQAIDRIKSFYTKENDAGKIVNSNLLNGEFLIFQLTRTHSITKEFRP
ncbi:hypothetical protein [Acinetobacter bereziniae]|uniref:hypothetical protein n=1 Tax=Acinetobacter bereziniae TaxID=106648 RepID=UPI0006690767|nr:hypothetical protein [Acinetobacter bereziniae]